MSVDVSIIIPTYNRLWSLPKTIASCKATQCSVEIIVIDDGSTDGTSAWLSTQPDLKVISQKNWGKCWAANLGFEMANGKYVRFLDSDDMLAENAVDEQFLIAEAENSDVVVSGYQVIDEQENLIRQQTWIICDDFISQQLGECDSSHYSAYLFNGEFIKDIPHRPDFAFRDDRLFVLEVALKNPKVGIHKGTALLHRAHNIDRLQFNNGLQQAVQNYQHLKAYQKIIGQLTDAGHLTKRRIDAAVKTLWPLTNWIAKNNIHEAKLVYGWIKELNPSFVNPDNNFNAKLYRVFGFNTMQKILKLRRFLKYGIN